MCKEFDNMNELLKKKILLVAIDSGFDGCKIRVNGYKMNTPFVIQDITGNEKSFQLTRRNDEFIEVKYEDNIYILGEPARKYLQRTNIDAATATQMKQFYEIGRYNMKLFEVALTSFIAHALYTYSKYTMSVPELENFDVTNMDDWKIYVGVALPHANLEELTPVVDSYLVGKDKDKKKRHILDLKVGNDDPVHFDFQIADTLFNSQVICALINEIVDENGNELDEMFENLPALIIDGGYKTVGEFVYECDQTISSDISNTDYAMLNVNEEVARKIAEYSDEGITDYQIEEMYKDNRTVAYLDENKECHELNVKDIKDKELANKARKMIEHLLLDYNDLLKIRMILIAGGTGESYYPYIKEYCEKERPYLSGKVILAGSNENNKFMGETTEAVYAVVTGLYKNMCITIA